MSALFSIAFTGLFVAFGVAAVIGHILLAEALVRPFFAKLATAKRPARIGALMASS
jgi:hypothetical protein